VPSDVDDTDGFALSRRRSSVDDDPDITAPANVPSIFRRIRRGSALDLELRSIRVPEWRDVWRMRAAPQPRRATGGRLLTSMFVGVHRTTPGGRWEAQFRMKCKPTSLGTFNTQEGAARAYDLMVMWRAIHEPASLRNQRINFGVNEYLPIMPALKAMGQLELIRELRRHGRDSSLLRDSHRYNEALFIMQALSRRAIVKKN
jgi:hypothetical protein